MSVAKDWKIHAEITASTKAEQLRVQGALHNFAKEHPGVKFTWVLGSTRRYRRRDKS